MVLVFVAVVAITGFGVYRLHGIFGSNDVVSWPQRRLDRRTPTTTPSRSCSKSSAVPGRWRPSTTSTNTPNPSASTTRRCPGRTLLTTTDPTLFADLRAQGDGDHLTCRITVNGIVKDERSTTNVNGYISCLDKSA